MFSFDEEELSTEESNEEIDNNAEQVVSSLEESASIDQQLTEVEKRLEVASYYRMLLNGSLFENSEESPIAQHVEKEVRDFVVKRLEVLLNIRQEASFTGALTKPTFSEEEIKVLRALASKVLNKPQILEQKPKNRPPTIRKAEAPKQTEVVEKSVPVNVVRKEIKSIQKVAGKKYKTVVTEEGKKVKLDVTGQVGGPGVVPMPTGQALTAIMAQKANDSVSDALKGNDALISTAVNITSRGEQ